jgi:TetR/AcrR family transcriptional repressor of nem operon
MARPREFDPDAALEEAMNVFWSRGYEQSSVDDLCRATGLNRSSLYACFGDKRTLLRRSLIRYADHSVGRLRAMLNPALPVRAGIGAWLRYLIDNILAGPGQDGCFIGNCAIELARHDRRARADVRTSLERIETLLAQALERAKGRGELGPDSDVTALARFFMAGFQGLRLIGKVYPDRRVLEDVAATMVRVLD